MSEGGEEAVSEGGEEAVSEGGDEAVSEGGEEAVSEGGEEAVSEGDQEAGLTIGNSVSTGLDKVTPVLHWDLRTCRQRVGF